MGKILWIDTETTGLDINKNDVIDIAFIVDIDGEIKEEGQFLLRPRAEAEVDEIALSVNGRTLEEIKSFPERHKTLLEFKTMLSRHVDKFNRTDKFVIAGYNVGFDTDFIRVAFEQDGDKYFGSWFHWPKLDIQFLVAERMILKGIILSNYKLSNVCQYYGVEIKAHESISDIRATRALYSSLSYNATF